MNIKNIIDISGTVNSMTVTWPGDKRHTLYCVQSIEKGDECNLSAMNTGMHTSTHIDTPLHFIAGGKDAATVDLSKFIGFAKVFDMHVDRCVTSSDLEYLGINANDIVLFKTSNSLLSMTDTFNCDFIHLDVSAAKFLVDKQIATVGIDYLSIEDYSSSHSTVHKMLLSHDIGIIEGLRLNNVSAGNYFISCLPLKIEGAEGTPVRAVLVEFE